MLDVFDEAHKFINMARDNKKGVLVHCARGVSRSSTVVIAYLMKENGWRFSEAFRFVANKRPMIRPNKGFVEQLMTFENQLFGNISTETEKLVNRFRN